MSKQSEAKDRQGYSTLQRNCGSCAHFECETEEHEGVFKTFYTIEKNKRCGLGGFAIKKTASCNLWEQKQ